MADVTEINPSLTNSTWINTDILQANDDSVTVLNPMVMSLTRFQPGSILNQKYKIISKLDSDSGEADLYLCVCEDKNYIAKVYRRDRNNKLDLVESLQHIDNEYVARVIESFDMDGLQVVIMPYYKNGSLAGCKVSEADLKNTIIPDLIEGINELHKNGIIHKDIKPSNIMWADNKKDVVLIDFGISSLMNGHTIVQTVTGFTPKYTAPEAFRVGFNELSDYYSLGITIFELLFGRTPYDGMSQEDIDKYYTVQNLPLPEDIASDFKDLLLGLTYFDIRNRKDESNPNCRWGYVKTKDWCAGGHPVVPGSGFGNIGGDMPAYRFQGNTYSTRESLVRAFAESWESSKPLLFRGEMTQFFSGFDKKTANALETFEKEYEANNKKEDYLFWKSLYVINSGTYEFYWKDNYYETVSQFGEFMIKALRNNSFEDKRIVYEVIKNRLLSEYAKIVNGSNTELISSIYELENVINELDGSKEKTLHSFQLAYVLLANKTYVIDKKEFETIREFIDYVLKLRSESIDKFEQLCRKIIDRENQLEPQFEAWVMAKGQLEIIQQWRKMLSV